MIFIKNMEMKVLKIRPPKISLPKNRLFKALLSIVFYNFFILPEKGATFYVKPRRKQLPKRCLPNPDFITNKYLTKVVSADVEEIKNIHEC